MNKKISCLLLSSFLLFSCTNNNVNSKDDVIYNENEDKLDCVSGAFGKENGELSVGFCWLCFSIDIYF